MTAREVLLKAAVHGDQFVAEHGVSVRLDIFRLMAAVCRQMAPRDEAYWLLVEHLKLGADPCAIGDWNDAPGRTAADVIAALRGAGAS